jgi:hypothetical protein
MNNELISETPAGGLFDPAVMERLVAETQRGCWFWLDWEIALMYRDLEWAPGGGANASSVGLLGMER